MSGVLRRWSGDSWLGVTSVQDKAMLEKLKQGWHNFEHGSPGERFRQRFKRRQQSERSLLNKILFVAGGVVIMAVGVFLLPAPGPGMLVLVIGAGLAAQESLLAARVLDWGELRVRRLAAWSLGVWRRASLLVKIALVLFVIVLVLVAGLGAYEVWLSN